MTGLKISKALLAVMLISAVTAGFAYVENATMDKVQSDVKDTGQKVNSPMNKIGNFMNDSTITAEVRATPVDHGSIRSIDISVRTDQKVVTLGGFVESQAQAEEAVKVAKGVESVTLASDKPHVHNSKDTFVKDYVGGVAITSKTKAKPLTDDTAPSRKAKAKATDGVVQLSDTVDSQAQSDHVEGIAKAAGDAKNIKNDLKTQ